MWKINFTLVFILLTPSLHAQPCADAKSALERFTIHDNATVTDKKTGLMWKRCLEDQAGSSCKGGFAREHSWSDALQHAKNHSFAGYNDWRLPNIKELISIIEENCSTPAINLNIFSSSIQPNDTTGNSRVLSSSPMPISNFGNGVLIVDFGSGEITGSSSGYIHLVRDIE